MALAAISSLTSFSALTPACMAASAGMLIITQLAQKALGALVAQSSLFSNEQQRNYVRFDTTDYRLDVNSLPPSDADNDFDALGPKSFPNLWEFTYQKAELALKAAAGDCEQAKKASWFNKPLFYNRARSVLWLLLEPRLVPGTSFLENLNENKAKQLKATHHDIMLAEAQSCHEAVDQTSSVPSKLEFLFAGIRALRLGHCDLVKGAVKTRLLDLDFKAHQELGALLWEKAALLLESLPEDAVLDMSVFGDCLHSDRPDVFSPKHAAARCYFNQCLTIYIRWSILEHRQQELEAVREKAESVCETALSTSLFLLNDLKLPPWSAEEDKAWLEVEKLEVSLRHRVDSPSRLALAAKAVEHFKTAAKTSKKPLKYWVQIAQLSKRCGDLAGEYHGTQNQAIPYYQQALDYAEKIKNRYPDVDISQTRVAQKAGLL